MKKVMISTFGTRGDIQPFVALGQGLIRAGYEVGLCTAEGFRGFIEEQGVPYLKMDNEILELTLGALGKVNGIGDAIQIGRKMQPAMRRAMDDEWQAAQSMQPDFMVFHPKCMGSVHVAEKLGIPAAISLPLPFYAPTRAFPIPFFANLPGGGTVNRLSYSFARVTSIMYGGLINDFRQKTLGLGKISRFTDLQKDAAGEPLPQIYPYSPHVLPVPEDFPPYAYVTGYWFLDDVTQWEPDEELVRFLEAGPPPVYLGFGSMGGQAEARTRTVLEGVAQSGVRAVLARGWGGLKAVDLPRDVYMVESVPHEWLFPRVAAVVHHGGAGTTAAGLRAGKPTLICPFLADQPFWGKVVAQAGVGPQPIPQKKLTAENLSAAIRRMVSDGAMQQRADALGSQIRAEDGVARAVEVVGGLAGREGI